MIIIHYPFSSSFHLSGWDLTPEHGALSHLSSIIQINPIHIFNPEIWIYNGINMD